MRTRLGAHLAGLLAAAGMPLSAEDLGRLAGRPAARVTELLPRTSTSDVRVTGEGWEPADAEAVARIVRNLHSGPLAAGAERRPEVQELALRPFRSALHAAVASARDEWGWGQAAPFTLSPAFTASMRARPQERRALVRLLTDPARARVVDLRHPDAARHQLREAATAIAAEATTDADLEDLATLLLAESRLDPVDGAVPRRLAPVFALLGDLERAVALAHEVRTDVAIELAYVACAAAQAGDPDADELAEQALTMLGDAPAGALLRTAQAVADLALHLPPARARARAEQARALVRRAFGEPERPPSVESLRSRQFRDARDHEWALAATTSATIAVALAQAADSAAAAEAVREARDAAGAVAGTAHRAVTLADAAARFAVRAAAPGGASTPLLLPLPLIEEAAAAAGSDALAAAEKAGDVAAFAAVALLLSGDAARDGDRPEAPAAPDTARAFAAARRALELIASGDSLPPRGALRDAARVLPAVDMSVHAARAVVERVQSARHGTSLERRTRARTEAAVLAEAAAVLDAAGAVAEARAAASAAREACGRVPAAARARPLAEIAAVLLGATDDEVFAVGQAAAEDERTATDGRWDAMAPALIAAATLAPAAHAPDPARRAILTQVRDESILELRRGEHAPSLTSLADRAARSGDTARAASLAGQALRAAHVRDPLRRERALAALAAVDAPAYGARAAEGSAPEPVPNVARTAQAWLADGYPIADLASLVASVPDVGARIVAAVRADLGR